VTIVLSAQAQFGGLVRVGVKEAQAALAAARMACRLLLGAHC
jgi:hypothetical protein